MPTNVLLLPLAGGYWFLHAFYYTRFRSQRLDGYRLLMESALAGIILAFIARPIVVAANLCPSVRYAWDVIAPDIPYLGTACAAALLGFISSYGLNFALAKTGFLTPLAAQQSAIQRYGNHLLQLLHSAQAQEKLISATLENGKVYIGLVSAAPNLEPHDTHLAITPFLSGYRVKETLELRLTVDYLRVYAEHALDPEDFKVIIAISSLRMASLFDQTIYPAFLVEA